MKQLHIARFALCAGMACAVAAFTGCDFGPPDPPRGVARQKVHTPVFNVDMLPTAGFYGFFADMNDQPQPVYITTFEYRLHGRDIPISLKHEEISSKTFFARIFQSYESDEFAANSTRCILIPGAAGFGKGEVPPGDILAFEVKDIASDVVAYPLASEKPQTGDYLWLIGILNDGEFIAVKYKDDQDGYMKLVWNKDVDIPNFRRSQGMPFINQNGEVVGITVHTGHEKGRQISIVNPVVNFLPALKDALAEN